MLINGREISADTVLAADVCVVGAGAAGLTLAQEFEATAIKVLLLESGSFHPDPATQDLADGTGAADDQPYPFLEARARCFGGSTTRWTGACIPLDAGDFQRKDWLPDSGWPFERSHLWPYYQRAQKVFGLPETAPTPPSHSPFHQDPLEAKVVQLSHPLDLGKKYRQQVVRSQNITLVTHANVTQLVASPDGRKVEYLVVSKDAEHSFRVQSRLVVLATGGMENARLLLASNSQFPQGLGNHHDLVGRFFMEHFYKVIGILPLNQRQQDARFFTNFVHLGQTPIQGTFGLTDEVRQREQLLNLHIRMYRYSLLEDTATVIAAKQLQTTLLYDRKPAKVRERVQELRSTRWQELPSYVGWHLWNKLFRSARFDHVRLQAWIEQEPTANNRITLSHQRDYLGQPKTHLSLRFSEQTWNSIERSLIHIGQALHNQGFGKLQYDPARLEHLTPYNKIGLHHMGTTRMHDSPRQGVVDANCQVHGLANVYVAGSSVFPTGGAANPTFTIAALAIRLADHIKMRCA